MSQFYVACIDSKEPSVEFLIFCENVFWTIGEFLISERKLEK